MSTLVIQKTNASEILSWRRALSFSLGHSFTDSELLNMNKAQFMDAMTDKRDMKRQKTLAEVNEETESLRNALKGVLT